MHVMLDLETFSTKPWAMILSMGAVLFDPNANTVPIYSEPDNIAWNTFYRRVNLDSMHECAAHVEQSTVLWWMRDYDDSGNSMAPARAEAFKPDNRYPINDVWAAFSEFCKANDVDYVWSHGLTFDVAILQNYVASHGLKWPVHFRNNRDTRTLFDDVPPDIIQSVWTEQKPDVIGAMCPHHPVYDSYVQARQVQVAKLYLRTVGAHRG